jgi:hypothetical protein
LAILDSTVFGDLLFAIEEDDAVFVGADFELTSKQRRGRGVAIARQANEAFDIDDTAVQCVHLGDIERQRLQRRPLSGPKLDGPGLQAFTELAILALAPVARLLM